MDLIASFVRNPVKVMVGVLLTVLFGIIALLRMPMQLTPEVQTPTLTIETLWPGASPQEVEREIVMEQEEQLKSVEGVTQMKSECADSRGTITLEFQVGTNMQKALLTVNSRLQQVREYPQDAKQPVLTTANSADRPIAWFILSAKRPDAAALQEFARRYPVLAEQVTRLSRQRNPGLLMKAIRELATDHVEFKELLGPPGLDVAKLRRLAEDEIEARFERISGISQSNVMGGLVEELQVIVDPQKLAARQLTLTHVRNVLLGQNRDTSAGDFWEGKRRWVVRSLGQFRSPQQVEDQLLAIQDGAPIYVRDVAEVQLGFKKPDGVVRRYGESCIAVNCIRDGGANVLEVMDSLRQEAAALNRSVLSPRGLQLTQVYDETEYINSAVNLVRQNILIGGALTMIVLMLFLHLNVRTLVTIPFALATAFAAAYLSTWYFVICLAILIGMGCWFARGALVVALSIPVSIVGTFLVLGLMGRSLNVISLAGMAFAVGMLVDNAVVVLENIYRRYAEGDAPFIAATRGTQEVWGAVVASTLTTVSVFLPVLFVQEEAGQLFRDIALAISAAVSLSLVVSVTLIPMLTTRLFREESADAMPTSKRGSARLAGLRAATETLPSRRETTFRLQRWIEYAGRQFTRLIVSSNRWLQRSTWRRVAFVLWTLVAAMGLSYAIWPKVEYLPTGNRNLVIAFLLPPPGYNLDKLMTLGETVEAGLLPYLEVEPTSAEAKQLPFPAIEDFFFVARGRQVFMGLRAADPIRAGELVPLIQSMSARLPGTIAVAKQSSLFETGLGAGRTVDIEISGPDLAELVAVGGRLFGRVREVIPDAQARPVPSLDLSTPEIHVRPKLLQAADMGLSSTDLGFVVDALVDGAYSGDYFDRGKKIDLTVMGESKYAQSTQDIGALPVSTPLGQLVTLDALATVELQSGPEQINHRERVRAVTIEVTPPPTMALEDAMQRIQSQVVQPMLDTQSPDDDVRIRLAGTADKLRETWLALRFNVILALLITYLLMAALFESWLYPFVIILSVPLGAVGGILGLHVLNHFVLQPLDVLTMLGFVILIGTVVNNPILIVHQALLLIRDDSLPPTTAILESVRTRIRPIFMTTTTTVLGLLPLVLFPGAGSELYRGLGSVVLGGLVISTFFTLVFVPTLFSLMMQAKGRLFGGWTEPGRLIDVDRPAIHTEERPAATHKSAS